MPTAQHRTPSGDGAHASETAPISRDLFEIRLRHRERRIRQVMRELRARVEAHTAGGHAVPRPLGQALESFAGELVEVRRALAAHGAARRPRDRV